MFERQELIKACASSIEVFGKLFMPRALNATTPAFHREIYRDLMDDSIKRLGIVAPRGHSKSTVTSIIYPLWRTIFKPKEEDLLILLVSESQSQSINFLAVIKHNLAHNPRVLEVFGSLEGSKWTEDDITTSNGVRIMAKGTGQRIRGTLMGRESITRPNLIILDDFESETNSLTPEAIDKNKDWITKAVEPSLADDGRLIAIGTIIGQRAYLMDIQQDPAWKTHFYQAFADGMAMNTPLWPERFSRERLLEFKASYEARGRGSAFWQEFMNVPIDMDQQTFRKEDFRYYDGAVKVVDKIQACIPAGAHPYAERYHWAPGMMIPLYVTIGVDLAISESLNADWTIILPLATDPKGNRFILPFTRLKTKDIDVIIDAMLLACRQYQAEHINIETVQYQQAVAVQFRKKMDELGMYIPVSETKPRTAKDSRIRSMQPLFRQHRVFMTEEMLELENELLNFPRAKHDDLLDALWLAEQVAMEPSLLPFEGDKLPEAEEEEELSWLVL